MSKHYESGSHMETINIPEPTLPEDPLDNWRDRVKNEHVRQQFSVEITNLRAAVARLVNERKLDLINPVRTWMKSIAENFGPLQDEGPTLFMEIPQYFSKLADYTDQLSTKLQAEIELKKPLINTTKRKRKKIDE